MKRLTKRELLDKLDNEREKIWEMVFNDTIPNYQDGVVYVNKETGEITTDPDPNDYNYIEFCRLQCDWRDWVDEADARVRYDWKTGKYYMLGDNASNPTTDEREITREEYEEQFVLAQREFFFDDFLNILKEFSKKI